jgi:hypothetical protein
VETISDPDAVYEIGVAIGDVMGNARSDAAAGADSAAINEYVANAARKRYGYVVEPVRVISWDHSKLLAA